MAKWTVVDNDKAPEDLSNLPTESKERLEILRALVPGKTIVIPVEQEKQRGYKAGLSRMATAQKMEVRVWSNGGDVCVQLKPAPEKA